MIIEDFDAFASLQKNDALMQKIIVTNAMHGFERVARDIMRFLAFFPAINKPERDIIAYEIELLCSDYQKHMRETAQRFVERIQIVIKSNASL